MQCMYARRAEDASLTGIEASLAELDIVDGDIPSEPVATGTDDVHAECSGAAKLDSGSLDPFVALVTGERPHLWGRASEYKDAIFI